LHQSGEPGSAAPLLQAATSIVVKQNSAAKARRMTVSSFWRR